ncbi:MAG: DUF11 domain-containing protein [Anaerolineae bacterium]|nr:DUF11 domain-containing protein [Anaerolineae bacterium]
MGSKRLLRVLTIVYVLAIILNSSSLLLPSLPAVEAIAAPPSAPVTASRPNGQTTTPGFCGTDGFDPDGSIGVGLTTVTTYSSIFGENTVAPGSSNGNPNGEVLRLIPGETIRFNLVISNDRASGDLTGVWGEIVMTHGPRLQPVWDVTPFDGVLSPGERITGHIDYVAQPTDPTLVNYTFYGWGYAGTAGRCDIDRASDPGINTEFRVEGPSITLSLTAPEAIEVGAPVTWTLTLQNNRPLTTTIDSISDLLLEGSAFGACTPAPSPPTLEQILQAQAGTNTLPASAGSSLSMTFSCNMLPAYPDPVVNEVTVLATAAGIQLPFRVTGTPVARAVPSIRVSKLADVDQAAIGDTITYTVRVENDGDTPLNSVTVVDSLTGLLVNVPKTLAPGASYQENVAYIVQENDPDPLVNILTGIGVSPQGATVSSNWTESVDKRNPALQLTVSAAPAAIAVGEVLTYTFQVTNTSTEGLVNVLVEFPLCAEPGAGTGCSGTRVLLGTPPAPSTSLLAGATVSGTFTYTIQGTEPDPFGFTPLTTARASAITNSGSTIADTASVLVDILDNQIRIEASADRETALRGDTITYTFTVSNLTSTPLQVLSITDTLLGAIGNIPAGGLLLDPATPYTFTEQYTISGSDPSPLVNVATVTAEGGITDSTSEVVEISNAQLFITVTSDPPSEQLPGLPVSYSVFVSNNGRITLTDITGFYQVVGLAQPEQQFSLQFPGQSAPSLAPGDLAPFELATGGFSRPVQSDDPDPLTVLVRIQGTDDKGTRRSFFATRTIDVLPAQLRVHKEANVTRAAVGDTVTYEFFVTNIQENEITNVSAVDSLCAADLSGCSGSTVLLAPYDPVTETTTGPFVSVIPSLQPGEMAYGTFNYTVLTADLSRQDRILKNRVTVSGTLQPTLHPVGDADEWDIQLVNPLVIDKVADRIIATDGQCVTYTFTVSNISNLSTITNITVSDTALGDLSAAFPPFSLPPGNVVTLSQTTPACTGATQHRVTADDLPAIANTVTARGVVNGQIVTAQDTWRVEVTSPILVQKTNIEPFFGFAVVGDVIRYRVTLTNVSDVPYSFISARDTSNSAYETERTLSTATLIANSADPANPALTPGESTSIEYTYEVGPRDPDELVNTFQVVMTNGVDTLTFSDTHSVDIYSPFLILKIPNRSFAVVGETIHYDYLVYNVSQIAMNQVTVVDDRLGPIANRRIDNPAVNPGTPYDTTPKTLPAARDYPCLFPICDASYLESNPAANNYTVRPTDLTSDKLVNTVTVRGTTTTDSREPGVTILSTQSAEVQIRNPLQVVKIGPPQASRGDSVTYAVTVTNTSPLASSNVITNISVIDAQTGEVAMTFPDPLNRPRTLNPGESAAGTVNLIIPQTASDPFVNTVNATGELIIDTNRYNLSTLGTASIDLDDPILEVVLLGSTDTAERNTLVTWSARLSNNGTSDLTNLTYSDATGINFATDSDCPTTLPVGAVDIVCTWQDLITDLDPDPFINTLRVEGETLGGTDVAAEAEFIVDVIDPRFRVSKVAVPNVAFVGDTIRYTITVTNASDSTMTGVTAYDSLTGPVPLQFPGGIPGVLNNNESATATISYTLSQADPSPLINLVTASGTTVAGNNLLTDSTYTTVLITASQLLVQKQASPATVQLGERITYNIAITNIGQIPIRNIQVVDSAVGLNTATNPNVCGGPVTYGGRSYTVNCTVRTPLTIAPIDALDPFEVAFLTYEVEVTADLPDPFVNEAVATGVDGQGNPIEGADTIAVNILTPGIQLTKTADRAGAAVGDTVLYTVELVNLGDTDLTNVQVIDNELGTPIQMSVEGGPLRTTIPALPPNQRAIGVIAYTVTTSTPNPFVNTVTVINDQGITDGAAATIDIRDLGIAVTKTPRTTSVVIGDTVTYDIEVTNTSGQPLSAISVIDHLSRLPIPLRDPATGAIIDTLEPDGRAVGAFDYTIPPGAPDPLVNRVTATGRASSGVTISSSGLALVDIREADLSLTKTASTGIALIGETVTYGFLVRNEGTSTLTNVALSDPLCVTADSGCTGGQVDLTFPGDPGVLEAGQEATGILTRAVRASDPDPLINIALATARTANGTTIQDTDSVSVQIASSDLVVSKTVAGIGGCAAPVVRPFARVGDIVAYRVRIENLGATPITNISVVDTTGGQDITARLLPGVTPPLTPTLGGFGSAETCIEIPVTATTPDPLINTVVATGLLGGVTFLTDTASASIPIASGDLFVTNVADRPSAAIGETITYMVTVRNTGLRTLNNVRATSPEAGGAIALDTDTLNPGQSTTGTYTHTITGLDSDPFVSTVTVTAIAPGPLTLTDTASASVDIVSPGIRLTKSATPTVATIGTEIAYTLTVTNTGAENITSFTVIDPLLGGDITGCFDPGVALPDPAPICTPPGASPLPLAPGASASATIRRILTSGDGDPATNTAAVTAAVFNPADPANPIMVADTARAQVIVAGSGLNVIKTADRAAAFDGDLVTYTLDITNTSTTPVTGLTVTDTLVSSITLPKYTLAIGERITTTYTHRVNAVLDPDPLVNTVQVVGRDGFGITVSDTSSATVAILNNTAIRVTVSADRTTVLAGQTVNYLATVTNIGGETLSGVSALATLPDGSALDLTGQFAMTTLAPGGSVVATFSYNVLLSDSSPLVASVIAQGTGPTVGTVSDTGSIAVTITLSSMSISATPLNCSTPCIGIAGDSIMFVANLRNDGATTLTNVSLTTNVPIQTTDPTSGLILTPGQRVTIEFVYIVPLNAPDPVNLTLQAQGLDPIGTTISRSYTYLLDTAAPRIDVSLSANREGAAPGEVVTYTAEIRNSGSEPLSDLALVDGLVGALTSRLPVRSLAPGQRTSVSYTYTVGTNTPDPLVSTVTASGMTSFNRSVADNDTYVLNVLRPQLYIRAVASKTVATLGERVDYTVSVLNVGDGPINNLRGSFVVDRSFTAGGQPRPAAQGGAIVLGTTTLPPGVATSGFFSYIPTTGDPNPLTIRVIVSGEGFVGTATLPVSAETTVTIALITTDPSGNPYIIGTPVPGVADPQVNKDVLQPFAAPGGQVTWTLTVRNPGTEPLAGVILTDTLDIKMQVESVTISNGTIEREGNTVVAVTNTLNFNDAATLTIVARVNEGVIAGAILQNVGCATSVGGSASICDTAAVRIVPDAALLPATGQATALENSDTAIFIAIATVIALLALGLLGMALGDPEHRGQLLTLAAIGVIVLLAIVIVVALIGGAGGSGGPQVEASATSAEVVEGIPQRPTLPPAFTPPPTPTPLPPTAIPIPAAQNTLPSPPEPTVVPPFRPQSERELFIPKLGLSSAVPIVNIPLRNRTWDVRDLGQNIGFLQGTTWVDEAAGEFGGNTVLAGHIQITQGVPGPFRDLDLLEVGDSIFLVDRHTIYEFQVSAIDVVAANDVEVTYPTAQQTLTLITCTTWNAFRGVFAERLVVRAQPVRTMTY